MEAKEKKQEVALVLYTESATECVYMVGGAEIYSSHLSIAVFFSGCHVFLLAMFSR